MSTLLLWLNSCTFAGCADAEATVPARHKNTARELEYRHRVVLEARKSSGAIWLLSIDTSHDDGNLGYEVPPEPDHPNHFTVIEEWTTRRSRDVRLVAAHTRAFRERLLPMEGALYDARLYNELD